MHQPVTASDLQAFIDAYRRVTGKEPKLRECVEHFDGKLLNVVVCLSQLDQTTKDEIRRLAREDRKVRT